MLFRRTKGRLSCDGLRLSNCQLSNYSAFMTSANWDPFKVATTCCRALFRRFLLWASALVNQILGNAGERLSATKLSGPNKSHRGSNMIQENREDMRAKKACNYQNKHVHMSGLLAHSSGYQRHCRATPAVEPDFRNGMFICKIAPSQTCRWRRSLLQQSSRPTPRRPPHQQLPRNACDG